MTKCNLRLDVGGVFAIGEVDIRSVDSNIMVLGDNAVGAHSRNQVIVLGLDHLSHRSKVVAELLCLEFAIGRPVESQFGYHFGIASSMLW